MMCWISTNRFLEAWWDSTGLNLVVYALRLLDVFVHLLKADSCKYRKLRDVIKRFKNSLWT
jgi:hypothetical protein